LVLVVEDEGGEGTEVVTEVTKDTLRMVVVVEGEKIARCIHTTCRN
jgi:hypothetical protein